MRKLIVVCGATILAGCSTIPDKPNFVVDLSGNYQSIADCAFIEFSKMSNSWSKIDHPTMSRTDFVNGDAHVKTGEIKISGTGPNMTHVESRMQVTFGEDRFWTERFRPIFEKCAADLAALRPLSVGEDE